MHASSEVQALLADGGFRNFRKRFANCRLPVSGSARSGNNATRYCA